MMQLFLVSFLLYVPLSGFVCASYFLLRSCLCTCSNMQPTCSVFLLPLCMSPFLSVKILLCSYAIKNCYNRTIFFYTQALFHYFETDVLCYEIGGFTKPPLLIPSCFKWDRLLSGKLTTLT